MIPPPYSSIEPLETRIAPASLTAIHPLPNIVAGLGKTGATVDLGNMFDPSPTANYHTFVDFTTNFVDPASPLGLPAHIVMELYDNLAPLTVQNFLHYVESSAGFENTFFHRLVSGFVLQGGEYKVTNPGSLIPTEPPVHNEVDPTNPLLSNTLGTIALPKSASGPNTGATGFFINLANNSSNLDHQDGGFTVFGKILDSSLTAVEDIGKLPVVSLSKSTGNGDLTSVPYQEGLPAGGVPGTSQLVRITGVHITPPNTGVSANTTFHVLSVTDAASGSPTNLVSASLAGETLNLHYLPGAAGVAKITVEATSGGNTLDESFTVTVKPNLIIESIGDSFPNIITSNQSGQAGFTIINTGAAVAKGRVEVKTYLGNDNNPPATFDPSTDQLIGDTFVNIDLGSGQSTLVFTPLHTPILHVGNLPFNSTKFQVIGQVVAPSVSELYTDDNASTDGPTHTYDKIFGSFNAGSNSSPRDEVNVPFSYYDANGHLVTLTLPNGGSGYLLAPAGGPLSLQIDSGLLNSASSVVNLSIAPGSSSDHVSAATHTTIGSITTNIPLGGLALGRVDLTGSLNVSDGIGFVQLGDLTSAGSTAGSITLAHAHGQALTPVAFLSFGNVTNYNLTSDAPVGALSASSWLNTTSGALPISVPTLGSLSIAHDFEANLTVANSGSVMKSFSVGGVLEDSTTNLNGSVTSVQVGAMNHSNFLVGVKLTSGTPAIPSSAAGFASTKSIGSFVLSGVEGVATAMVASDVAAADFGSISVASVDASTEANGFGFLADMITRYQRGAMPPLAKPPAGVYDQTGSYSVRIFAPA